MTTSIARAAALAAALILFTQGQAAALSIREWRKHNRDQQAVYVVAAVSMAANMYAAQGNIAKATCIIDWYIRGKDGHEPTGPHDLALEIGVAERSDPDKYQIEGVILGVADRACPVDSTRR